ncbi:MAG: glutathione peroxidase [Bacteroidota bacterium]
MIINKISKLVVLSYLLVASACARPAERPANTSTPMNATGFYDIKINDINGKSFDLHALKGKKILIVNTASECGYTPQYADLEQLHEKYGDKIAVLGVPCNQFGGQEPGGASEITSFCSSKFGVKFSLLEKSEVRGDNRCELYRWLTDKSLNGWNSQEPTWNFCKYLIDENGNLSSFLPSSVKPMDEKIISSLR